MRSDISLVFDPRRTLDLAVDVPSDASTPRQGRDWIDQTWEALGCEPLRPSGKVLLLDKVLGIADAYGYDKLRAEPALAQAFAENVARALDRPHITIDLPAQRVGY